MTIESSNSDILSLAVDAIVNPVNTVGVMGKGLALQIKQSFPECFESYAAACRLGEVRVGLMHVVPRAGVPRFIINFPTKEHWRQPSKIEYIHAGLMDLVQQVRRLSISSIAIPMLGCGNGGLDWRQVRPFIVDAFKPIPEVRVVLCEPCLSVEIVEQALREMFGKKE